jgi:hypothetical protein
MLFKRLNNYQIAMFISGLIAFPGYYGPGPEKPVLCAVERNICGSATLKVGICFKYRTEVRKYVE